MRAREKESKCERERRTESRGESTLPSIHFSFFLLSGARLEKGQAGFGFLSLFVVRGTLTSRVHALSDPRSKGFRLSQK